MGSVQKNDRRLTRLDLLWKDSPGGHRMRPEVETGLCSEERKARATRGDGRSRGGKGQRMRGGGRGRGSDGRPCAPCAGSRHVICETARETARSGEESARSGPGTVHGVAPAAPRCWGEAGEGPGRPARPRGRGRGGRRAAQRGEERLENLERGRELRRWLERGVGFLEPSETLMEAFPVPGAVADSGHMGAKETHPAPPTGAL